MSVITFDRNAAYEYAYTRADQQEETVVIYVRTVVGDESDAVMLQYIATGLDSDKPTGSTIETVIDPNRSPLYDQPYRQGLCC